MVLALLTGFFLWTTLFLTNKTLFGYSQTLLLTYVFGASLLNAIILSTRTSGVSDDINNGNLSNFLIRPINYFYYWFARDLGDKALNVGFSLTEFVFLIWLLHPPLFLQTNLFVLFLFVISILFAIVIYFFLNFLVGCIGFWSADVWAPRFLFYMILIYSAGSLFPLDILPKLIYEITQLLPFSYLLYFPLKIYLGQITALGIIKGFIIGGIWIGALYKIVLFVWHKGLTTYTAQGR